VVAPAVEGALAPNPLLLTPPTQGKAEPLREIPGLRRKDKREKSWKDEVRERVRHRKHERAGRGGEELPLFRDEPAAATEPVLESESSGAEAPDPYAITERVAAEKPGADVADFVMRPPEPVRSQAESDASVPAPAAGFDDEPRPWELDAAPAPLRETRPVERPARVAERVQAAVLDLVVLLALWSAVVYFAGRAGRVSVSGLLPAWPYLAAYLAGLGLCYATYFTGTTGQTFGKMIGGLRVVDTGGRPPGYPRAFVRAALGALGLAVALLGGAPMFFDPARRALHDRLLKTRVIRT
jgi:uncharacterized RDD family membrane protein YckC